MYVVVVCVCYCCRVAVVVVCVCCRCMCLMLLCVLLLYEPPATVCLLVVMCNVVFVGADVVVCFCCVPTCVVCMLLLCFAVYIQLHCSGCCRYVHVRTMCMLLPFAFLMLCYC